MTDLIEKFLQENGPCLTSDVSNHLVNSLGISPGTARQRVSRVQGKVKKLAYITFSRKARFIYLEQDFGSPKYWNNLIDALLATNSAYGLAISAVKQRGGIIPAAHFGIACGSPNRQAKHLSPQSVLARLKKAGLFEDKEISGLGDCITLVQYDGYYDYAINKVLARILTEKLLLTAIKDWIKKLGFGSYEKVATRDDDKAPSVGTFYWDLTAPSYMGCMIKRGKDGQIKPGFIACDVLLVEEVTEAGIKPFINKCNTLRQLRNVGPCMQIFVANRYSKEAFSLAKKNGIIAATPEHLFGIEVAEGLCELSIVLADTALSVVDPVKFDRLFTSLSKIEGASFQLRGTLFEYIAAEIARKSISSNVKMNREYKAPNGKKAEADVIAVVDDTSVHFIECKGHNPNHNVGDEHMEKWISERVPTLYDVARAHPDWEKLNIHFEFWCTGGLSDISKKRFEEAKSKVKSTRYTMGLKLGSEILKVCETTKNKGLIIAFKKHFMTL